MAIVVAGLNHKSAPIALLERLAIRHDRLPKALGELSNRAHVLEGVILSTCNRVEVYAAVTKFHGGAQDLRDFLAEFCHVAPEDFVDRMYTYHDDAALRHLFRVAAGVDSMIVGESEILGQLRRALALAREEGVVRRELETVFLYALRAGRRARAETGIARHPASISSAAVELARQTFGSKEGSLAGRRVLVVGAGKMGRLAADALRRAGVTQVVVVNRTEERAHALADSFGVTVLPIAELSPALASSDVMICSTGAPEPLVDSDLVRQTMSHRPDRPLLIVDIGVPRNVDAAVADVPGVSLRDIDALRDVTAASTATRVGELPKVEQIISQELEGLTRARRGRDASVERAALIERAESIRRHELERAEPVLASLSYEQRESVERLTKRLTAKLVHSSLEDVNRAFIDGSRGEGAASPEPSA